MAFASFECIHSPDSEHYHFVLLEPERFTRHAPTRPVGSRVAMIPRGMKYLHCAKTTGALVREEALHFESGPAADGYDTVSPVPAPPVHVPPAKGDFPAIGHKGHPRRCEPRGYERSEERR